MRGYLRDEIAGEVGCGRIPLLNAASHDTASAVAAVPEQSDNFVCISSGTWSIMGVELKQPATSVKVMNSGYSNEGGLNGTTVQFGAKTFDCAAADGKALFAKDHPAKVKGKAQSNLFTGDLTAANLSLLETRMQNTVGDNG